MKLQTKINKLKIRLTSRANHQGLYENFGEKEARALRDEYINGSDYTKEMNENRKLINDFENWSGSLEVGK